MATYVGHLCATHTRQDSGHKTATAGIAGIDEMWVRPSGPPRIIESDQAGGLNTEEAKMNLAALDAGLMEKGVNVHARMVARAATS